MINSLEEGLKQTFGLIEATSAERQHIWERWSKDKGFTWEQQGGFFVTVGILLERPICISVLFVRINGKLILFWYATSELVDYVMITEWLKKNLPDVYHRRSDATNCAHVLNYLD